MLLQRLMVINIQHLYIYTVYSAFKKMKQIKRINTHLDLCSINRVALRHMWIGVLKKCFSQRHSNLISAALNFIFTLRHPRVTWSHNRFPFEIRCTFWSTNTKPLFSELKWNDHSSAISCQWFRVSFSSLSVPSRCRWDLYHLCGSEDDEDEDDQHDHPDYNHHFDVFPPVFPGNPCGRPLEWVRGCLQVISLADKII